MRFRDRVSGAWRLLQAVSLVLLSSVAAAQSTPPAYVLSGPLLPLILQAPENGWIRVNVNRFQDVWTPDDLEPYMGALNRSPSRIIAAWSGFGWDSNRGDLILYGGGHANYGGNDVYRWHSSNFLWERASLPSDIYIDPVIDPIAGYQPIDGVDHAPVSAHTYDNNGFLPIADRFIAFGGAAWNTGGPYERRDETNPTVARLTGPFLFDPNKADGNKVGGTTGSNVTRVDPTPIAGGNMWQNRDWTKNIAGQQIPGLHRDGCTGYTIENGKDVVYIGASNQFSTQLDLYRFQLNDVNNPALDQVTKVGAYFSGTDGTKTCGYDPARKLFVRSGTNTTPFFFWDLTTPGPSNFDKTVQVDSTIASFQSWLSANSFDMHNCAFEFDPTRGNFPIWCGGPTIWRLKEPPANTTSGWTVVQQPPPTTGAPSTAVQALDILGKWRYAPYYDVFVALENEFDGNVWIYKPIGWSQPNVPGNALPTVSVLSPSAGSTVAPGATVNLTAAASDADNGIARVEYYVNGQKVGQATSAPYTVPIAPVLVGSYTVIAVAVDNVGGMGKSTSVTFNVNATLTTTVLQRGLNGYAGVTDTYLDNTQKTTPHGTSDPIWLDQSNYTPLVRFAIFQSEGGPVPNGAVLQSATLSIYKQYYSDALQLNSLLVPWTEAAATWNSRQAGVPWSAGGASNPGVDYVAAPDSLVALPDYNPGFVDFDVTARVQQWSNGSATNNGWRMLQASSGLNPKQFVSSEDPSVSLRPRLTLVWSGGGATNPPPTVSITSPASPKTITLGASVTLQASASDNGSVSKVVYSVGGSAISGALTTSPYTFVWTPAAVGTYTVIATATDNQGATGTSAPVTVTVNPVVSGSNRHKIDFDANGKHDIVWRNASTGASAIWLMSGLTAASSSVVLTDPAYSITHTGDLSGDGKTDLIWRHTSGATVAWLMNGTSYTSYATLISDPNWVVQRLADFNGDGKADILWHNNATGQTAIWLMNGLGPIGSAVILTDPNWTVTQVGDFNVDGKADLLWHNAATGGTAIWLMNGTSVLGSVTLITDPNWVVTNVGDFNGDGKSDLVWRNAGTGQTAIWLMNGTAALGSGVIFTSTQWQVTHVGDFDGNGKDDLVWRNTSTGQTAVWLMNGSATVSSAVVLTDTNWQVTHVADTNGDGKSDLVWRNTSTGMTTVWLMNGTTYSSYAAILSDPNWSLSPPNGL